MAVSVAAEVEVRHRGRCQTVRSLAPRIEYTTNAIEALNVKLRRVVRARDHFRTEEAAMKLILFVLNRSEKGVESAAL